MKGKQDMSIRSSTRLKRFLFLHSNHLVLGSDLIFLHYETTVGANQRLTNKKRLQLVLPQQPCNTLDLIHLSLSSLDLRIRSLFSSFLFLQTASIFLSVNS